MSTKKPSSDTQKANKIIIIICLAVIVFFGLAVALRDDKSAKPAVVNDNLSSSLYLSPEKQSLSPGADFAVNIWANSGDQDVRAIQANLAYPQDKLEVVSIDTTSSAFTMKAQSDGANGKVAIALANIKSLRGNLLVATVNMHVKGKTGEAKVAFDKGTALLSSSTNKDIVESKSAATYTIK